MPDLSVWDHVFVVAVFVVFPIYSKFTIGRVLNDIRERGEPARVGVYKQVILTWIVFSAYILVIWLLLERSWGDIGIRGAEPSRVAIAIVIATVVIALVVVPLRNISLSKERHRELDIQIGDIGVFMPQSSLEEKWFTGVSVNAGLSEELVFRGYLLWYLQHFVGLWWAALIAVLLFGLAHSYQGIKMLPGILLISTVAVFLYIYTESLLVPIALHVAIDAIQGHYIAKIRRQQLELA